MTNRTNKPTNKQKSSFNYKDRYANTTTVEKNSIKEMMKKYFISSPLC